MEPTSWASHGAVKIGTDALVDQGEVNEDVQYWVATEMLERRMRHRWDILVTSAAVALGAAEFTEHESRDMEAAVRLNSTIGQKKLMRSWQDAFERAARELGIDQRIHTAEGDVTRKDLDSDGRLNMNAVIREAQFLERQGRDLIFTIFNGNDLVAKEHIKNDNDGLVSDLARAIAAKELFILSNVNGLYTGDPKLTDSQLVTEVCFDVRQALEDSAAYSYISSNGSSNGTGGMKTKLKGIFDFLREIADSVAYIGNGTKQGIIKDLEATQDGTRFTALQA